MGDPYTIALWIVGILASIIVFRFAVTFNFNQWMKRRDQRSKERLKMLCPHATPDMEGGSIVIKSTFTSPPGTTMWICNRCQLKTYDRSVPTEIMARYANNPMQLIKNEGKFQKSIAKHYRL